MHPDLGLYFVLPEGWSTFNTPTFLGAIDEENDRGMIYLGMADTNTTPEELGIGFAEKLKKNHNMVPDRHEKITINGLDAFVVSIIDSSGSEPVVIHNLWFTLNNITFQVIGASYESDYGLLKKSAQSLRVITNDEKESIEIPVLRFIAANEGETIEAFNERSGNTWDMQLTAVMNNIPIDKPLKKGQLVKIARKEKYMEPLKFLYN